jgi:spore coat protein U-like protein
MAALSSGESGTISDRYMRCISGACLSNGFSGDELHYDLYTTSSHASVWGTATVPSSPADCGNATCAWTLFGLLPAAIARGINDVSVGGYSDTVTITVSY